MLPEGHASDVPSKSPSNERIAITGTCLADGTEIVLDQDQATAVGGRVVRLQILNTCPCPVRRSVCRTSDILRIHDVLYRFVQSDRHDKARGDYTPWVHAVPGPEDGRNGLLPDHIE